MYTEESIDELKQKVRAGDVQSMLALGELYEETKSDNTLAMKMYEWAYRKAEDPYWKEIAAAYLASHYLDSNDSRDWYRANEVIRTAVSERGAFFAPSAYLIGDMQQFGKGYRQRDHSAYESYLVAMDLVHDTEENRRFLGQVLMRYGEIYANGLYVPVDTERAERYYNEAGVLFEQQRNYNDMFAVRALKRLRADQRMLSEIIK